jgi:hypothetical protein
MGKGREKLKVAEWRAVLAFDKRSCHSFRELKQISPMRQIQVHCICSGQSIWKQHVI